ncbi:MAG: DUF1571 domain-containing protein [Deltaproteobacteria bacterium]|nr:DUF1571 domain-containing protein [Deltaproteobacteria bacterium]
MLAAAVSAGGPAHGVIDEALRSFNELESYSVTLRSLGADKDEREIIRYYYKKPGFVRMEFEKPHGGAVLVYDPRSKKARLRPFGFFRSFVLTLDPGSSLIKSSRGHTVDESDIGALLENLKTLSEGGKTVVLREEEAGGRAASVVSVEGGEGAETDGVHRYVIWFDKKAHLPLKVISYDIDGNLVEEVLMDGMEVNPGLPVDFFR